MTLGQVCEFSLRKSRLCKSDLKLTAEFCICIKEKGVLPTINGRLTQR
jgi:hypothetical protein